LPIMLYDKHASGSKAYLNLAKKVIGQLWKMH
jgi:hypothetical protein